MRGVRSCWFGHDHVSDACYIKDVVGTPRSWTGNETAAVCLVRGSLKMEGRGLKTFIVSASAAEDPNAPNDSSTRNRTGPATTSVEAGCHGSVLCGCRQMPTSQVRTALKESRCCCGRQVQWTSRGTVINTLFCGWQR